MYISLAIFDLYLSLLTVVITANQEFLLSNYYCRSKDHQS